MQRKTVEGVPPGVAGRLIAAGFSAEAAQRIADTAGPSADPAAALESVFASARVEYPVENRTAIITVQGAPGSGRTTALMRMALDCADSGREAVEVVSLAFGALSWRNRLALPDTKHLPDALT